MQVSLVIQLMRSCRYWNPAIIYSGSSHGLKGCKPQSPRPDGPHSAGKVRVIMDWLACRRCQCFGQALVAPILMILISSGLCTTVLSGHSG